MSTPPVLVATFLLLCVPSASLHALPSEGPPYEAGEPGVEVPRLIPESRSAVPYPEEARARGIEGTVLLRLLVDESGRVARAEIFRAPYRGEPLAEAAVEAARGWRYEPARLDGRPVACWIMATVPFHLPAGEASRPMRKDPGKPGGGPRETPPPASPEPAPTPEQEPPEEGFGPTHGPVGYSPTREEPPEAGIEIPRGGPGGLLLGVPADQALRSLPAAVRTVSAGGRPVLRSRERGVEVTLVPSPEGEGERVGVIRYVFLEGLDGFSACSQRTRRGLGEGTLCMGVIPAYGRPELREETTGEDGRSITTLRYRRQGTRVTFVCVDRRLVELTLAGEDG